MMALDTPLALRARGRRIAFPRRPLTMGILNLNADSFSDSGSPDLDTALSRARTLLAQGADILDIGAETARTDRGPISEEEEIERLLPFVRAFPPLRDDPATRPWDNAQLWPPLLSINTWRPAVARSILSEGGDILNDMGGLPTPENAAICAEHGAALVIMHTTAPPKIAQRGRTYPDILQTLLEFFAEKKEHALAAGLTEEQILFDPGLDFAKDLQDNLAIVARARELRALQRPILFPISRKTFLGEALDIAHPADRDPATLAVLSALLSQCPEAIFRVHNAEACAQSTKVLWEVAGRGDEI